MLGGVYEVAKLDSLLLSILSSNGGNITTPFKNSEVEFKYQNKHVAKGNLKNKVFYLDLIVSGPPSISNVSLSVALTFRPPRYEIVWENKTNF
jgi:hypothetical protein